MKEYRIDGRERPGLEQVETELHVAPEIGVGLRRQDGREGEDPKDASKKAAEVRIHAVARQSSVARFGLASTRIKQGR